MSDKERYEVLKKLYEARGGLDYSLAVFGDHIAEREGYKAHRDIDAVHYYLVHKFSWLPAKVKAMSFDDIRFVLAEELDGWVLPEDAR